MIKIVRCIGFVLSLYIVTNAADTLNDSILGYSIYLPDHWIRDMDSAAHQRFYDTTGTYQSLIAIVRYDFSVDTVFSTAEDWTRANFIAYILSVQADPLCDLLFYDSSTVKQDSVLWAPEAMTAFYSYDSSVEDYTEYIRYTASGKYGYEIYAIGPMADMDSNIALYASIIGNIELPISDVSVLNPRTGARQAAWVRAMTTRPTVNPLGRRLNPCGRTFASQIIIAPDGYSYIRGQAKKPFLWRPVTAKQ